MTPQGCQQLHPRQRPRRQYRQAEKCAQLETAPHRWSWLRQVLQRPRQAHVGSQIPNGLPPCEHQLISFETQWSRESTTSLTGPWHRTSNLPVSSLTRRHAVPHACRYIEARSILWPHLGSQRQFSFCIGRSTHGLDHTTVSPFLLPSPSMRRFRRHVLRSRHFDPSEANADPRAWRSRCHHLHTGNLLLSSALQSPVRDLEARSIRSCLWPWRTAYPSHSSCWWSTASSGDTLGGPPHRRQQSISAIRRDPTWLSSHRRRVTPEPDFTGSATNVGSHTHSTRESYRASLLSLGHESASGHCYDTTCRTIWTSTYIYIYIYNLLYIVSFAIFCHRLLHGLSPRQDELSAKDLAYTMQVAGICRDGPSIPWSVGSPRLDTPRVLRIPLSYFNSFELRKRQTSRI